MTHQNLESSTRPVHVRSLSDESLSRLHQRLRQRGVRVDAVGEVSRDGGGFDGDHTFGDQFTRAGSDDADAEDSVGFVFDDQFRQPSVRASDWARPLAAHGKRMTFTSRS